MKLKINKKAIESFPFRLVIVGIVIVFILGMGLEIISISKEYQAEQKIGSSYESIERTIQELQINNEYGSFRRIEIEVPENYAIEINSENNTITLFKGNETAVYNLTGDIINNIILEHGKYEIEIYYGPLNLSEIKNFTIAFT